MIQVFRIRTSPDAPRLQIIRPEQYGPGFLRFDGTEKGHLSPNRAFDAVADPCSRVRQFYSLAPGVLAGSAAALNDCLDMYYVTLGNERLSILAGAMPFIGINSINFVSSPKDGSSAPCLVDKFYGPIFRIEGRDPLEVFCVSGFDVPGDEFKFVYDTNGFSGLDFEEIWRG